MNAQKVSLFDPLPCPCGLGPVWMGSALVTWCVCEELIQIEGETPEETIMLWNERQK